MNNTANDEDLNILCQDISVRTPHRLFALDRKQKGVVGKSKSSLDRQGSIASTPAPLRYQSLMQINRKEDEENRGNERGRSDDSSGEMRSVLYATLRVLEMLARRGQDVPTSRVTWGEIKKIAERGERR